MMNNLPTGVRSDFKSSYGKLESIAADVRQELKISADQAIDSLQLFENLFEINISKRDGTSIPLGGYVIELDSEGYTRYNSERRAIEIFASSQTYDRLEEGHPRASYFVSHELGHCLLHTDQLIRLAKMPTNQQAAFHRGGQRSHKPFEDTEWQANAFASALLMPALGLAGLEEEDGFLTAASIATQFGVSREAATYRMKTFCDRRSELLS